MGATAGKDVTLVNRFATLVLLLVATTPLARPAAAVDPFHEIEELNFYEWTAVAPVVVAGRSLGETGKFLEFRVDRVLRGALDAGSTIRIELGRTNRERRRSDYPLALKMPLDIDYVVVLKEPSQTADGAHSYPMARSVLSARELPLEAQQGVLDAIAMFIAIQDRKDDGVIWRSMGLLLEETNPLVLRTALEQLIKFRRGTAELLASLRPLLDHPVAPIREGAVKVTGQIVERNLDGAVPEEEALMAELIGVARRDDVVEPRLAATIALAAFGVQQVAPVLEEIAKSDPDQRVRYSAERLLLQYRKEQEAEARRPRLDPASH